MNELLKIMDDQMLNWVKELDELYKRNIVANKAIQQLEQRIAKARELCEILREEQG